MWNAGLDEAEAGIKIAGRNINNLRYTDDTTLMAESKKRTKEPLDESEREEWKSWLTTQHSKNKDHGILPITPWQIDGETMETVTDFISRGSKITDNGDYSHEVKRRLLLGRKAMTNLDSILKSRDITLPTSLSSQSYGFSSSHVWMWELDSKESWVPNNWCFWAVVLESWESLGLQGDPTSPS